jgi:ubiquitin carboxyl-terminal hydrolase 36/42
VQRLQVPTAVPLVVLEYNGVDHFASRRPHQQPTYEVPSWLNFDVRGSGEGERGDLVEGGEVESTTLPCGLVNLGNSCFINATLQALLHVPAIRVQLAHAQTCALGFCPVKELALLRASGGGRRSVSPAAFFDQLWPRGSARSQNGVLGSDELRKGKQGCAAEFLVKLLDCLDSAACTNGKSMHALFCGTERSTVTCGECQVPKPDDKPFEVLAVSIQDTVEDALAQYQTREEMNGDNQYSCEACRCKRDAVKQLELVALPLVLALHLKRFVGLQKNDKHVAFKETLEQGDESFDLCAVVVHAGATIKSGHYYAYVRNGRGWLKCNDKIVESVMWETVAEAEAYVLIYQRNVAGAGAGESAPLADELMDDQVRNGRCFYADARHASDAAETTNVPHCALTVVHALLYVCNTWFN